MKIQLASDPGILNLYTQNTARITMGQGQNSNLQKVIQQVNALMAAGEATIRLT